MAWIRESLFNGFTPHFVPIPHQLWVAAKCLFGGEVFRLVVFPQAGQGIAESGDARLSGNSGTGENGDSFGAPDGLLRGQHIFHRLLQSSTMTNAVRCLCLLAAWTLYGQSSGPDLDAISKRVIAQQGVVGASVLVARDGKVVFQRGYGFADLGLEAPTKSDSVYHVVGPMMPITGVAIMQQVERGKLSLDDDVSKFIPEFPLQGHHVSIRQLLNHTSGIVDYHYLGDPIEATSRQPKALDEVMGLYSGKRWVNEPGTKWDWSISGFQLLVTVLERVTGQSYQEYVAKEILTPTGVESTTYCDDYTLTRGLSHG